MADCDDVDVDDLSAPTLTTFLKCGAIEIQKLKERVSDLLVDISALAAATGVAVSPIVLRHFVETKYTYTTDAGAVELDFSLGSYAVITLTENLTDITFEADSLPAINKIAQMTLELIQDGSGNRIVTWPVNFKWAAGQAPTLSTAGGKKDIISFYTADGGATYNAFVIGIGMA